MKIKQKSFVLLLIKRQYCSFGTRGKRKLGKKHLERKLTVIVFEIWSLKRNYSQHALIRTLKGPKTTVNTQ